MLVDQRQAFHDALIYVSGGVCSAALSNHPACVANPNGLADGSQSELASNLFDDIAMVFGGQSLPPLGNATASLGQLYVNLIARNISHEAAHTFGLEHVAGPANSFDLPHELMNVEPHVDYTHDFGFTDVVLEIDGGGAQNSHDVLTQTLGVSPSAWAAALRNREITIVGTSADNHFVIDVDPQDGSWQITIDGQNVAQHVQPQNPDLLSLNPFSIDALTVIGRGGNDTLTINGTITATITTDIDDDAPVVGNHAATLSEGQTLVLAAAHLSATDVDSDDAALQFTISAAPAHGTLSLNGVALAAGQSFTQAQLVAGEVRYAHDGSNTTTDAFTFTVVDPAGNSAPATDMALTIT
ncbi:MAG: hypothetical protein KDA62_21410, partial [Planctomycetales bacterium]|nr:hypothetical protein [Planctomycetales bacterium]